jgi:thioredoxin-related protein
VYVKKCNTILTAKTAVRFTKIIGGTVLAYVGESHNSKQNSINMKFITAVLFSTLLATSSGWLNNLEEAKTTASQKHELIVLNFSGSDWCGPCIRLKKEIFEADVFKNYANDNLVLVNADFPRSKKNQLSKEQVKINEALADKYNPKGVFPLTLVLNADGKVLKTYEGLPALSAEEFINSIKKLNNSNK